jgi:hypothetical protein
MVMEKKSNWQDFEQVLKDGRISKLYHFTDRDNLESIIKNGGLYSWKDCEDKGIQIAKPGGSGTSRSLDQRDGLEYYARLSFVPDHPMMYVAMDDGRISNPVVLEIDIEAALWEDTLYADRNMTKNGANVGGTLDDLKAVHFGLFWGRRYFDMNDEAKMYYKAEVLVKHFIPLKYITNIGNFGIPIPAQPKMLQAKTPYTAQITRNTPTAFIFLVDQSISMSRSTTFRGEKMTMAEAVARIVNNQINELVLRCVKMGETRHYYDIAVIGYGDDATYGWKGALEGRDFVSPEELKSHPYTKIITRKEVRTRKGVQVKEVEEVQWLEPVAVGEYTRANKAFTMARELLEKWMEEHHDKDCYPPTIINITDGEFNGIVNPRGVNTELADELKAMFTNDGNVLLWNIHITPGDNKQILLPTDKSELDETDNKYAEWLYSMSSLLPSRYNDMVSSLRGGTSSERHVAMAMNTDMSTLIQLMDIGTPTNISKNQ